MSSEQFANSFDNVAGGDLLRLVVFEKAEEGTIAGGGGTEGAFDGGDVGSGGGDGWCCCG